MNFDSIRNLWFIVLIVIFLSSIITLITSSNIEGLEGLETQNATTTAQQGYTNPRLANLTFTPPAPITYIETAKDAMPIVKLQNFFTNLSNSASKLDEVLLPLSLQYMKLGDSLRYLSTMQYTDVIPSNISSILSDDAKKQINTAIANKINTQMQIIGNDYTNFLVGVDKTNQGLNGYRFLNDFRYDLRNMKIACNGIFG